MDLSLNEDRTGTISDVAFGSVLPQRQVKSAGAQSTLQSFGSAASRATATTQAIATDLAFDWSIENETLTISGTYSYDGNTWDYSFDFAESPTETDAALEGWWEITNTTGSETRFQGSDFLHISIADISVFRDYYENWADTTGGEPLNGNMVVWRYTDSDEDGEPDASEAENFPLGMYGDAFAPAAGQVEIDGVLFEATVEGNSLTLINQNTESTADLSRYDF
jgi:hypothetical protein